MKKTKLFFLFPGPKYYLENTIGKRFKYLSQKYEGVIFTTPHGDCTHLSKFTVRTVEYQYTSQLKHNLYYLLGALKLAREIKKHKIDIVISYDPIVTGITAYLISRYIGAKLIVEVNGDFTHPAIYKDQKNKIIAFIKKSIFKTIAKFVIRKSNGVKLLYKSQIDWINMKHYKGQVLVGPNLVDIEPFLEKANQFTEENTILVIGFPFYIKGIDIAIKAFHSIEKQFPDWSLKILGWYPRPEKILELIGNSEQIHLLKPVPYSEMVRKISTAKIIAQPSRTEAMGRALVEAAAAGKARIASNVGGIPTVLEHNKTGLLVEAGNVTDLADNLKLLIENKKLRIQLGSAAKNFIQDHMSVDNYIRSNSAFYQEVLKS